MPARSSNKEKHYLYRFSDLFLVRCTRCDKQAKVILRDLNTGAEELAKRGWGALIFAARRLVCFHCGYMAEGHHRVVLYVEGGDWYFHLPLWLQTPCCGGCCGPSTRRTWASSRSSCGRRYAIAGATRRLPAVCRGG
ncbi:MAG TPA: hypothetical protein VEX13_16705 [Chloroflexia bacterium]|nr:hypothetical protein [Chloroflexia bacterium]